MILKNSISYVFSSRTHTFFRSLFLSPHGYNIIVNLKKKIMHS